MSFNSTFSTWSNNIIWGLYKLGGDVTVIDGITNYGDVECKCKHYEGELADFVAQGIKSHLRNRTDEYSTFGPNDETEQKQMLSLVSKIASSPFCYYN